MKIIVKPTSANLWWGIVGLTEKTGWEDLILAYDDGKKIGGVCLSTKAYLRGEIEELKEEPAEAELVAAIANYLEGDQIQYWYYYSSEEKQSKDFFEVPYEAPRNAAGKKPNALEIWHPDEGINLATIRSAAQAFAERFLDMPKCEIEIVGMDDLEELIRSFKEEQKLFNGEQPLKIECSDELISELSKLWNKSEAAVLEKLKKAIIR